MNIFKWMLNKKILILTIYDVAENASPPKNPNKPPKNGKLTATNPTRTVNKWNFRIKLNIHAYITQFIVNNICLEQPHENVIYLTQYWSYPHICFEQRSEESLRDRNETFAPNKTRVYQKLASRKPWTKRKQLLSYNLMKYFFDIDDI